MRALPHIAGTVVALLLLAFQANAEDTGLDGRWRAISQGRLGEGLIELDIAGTSAGKPAIRLAGTNRGIDSSAVESIALSDSGIQSTFLYMPYDITGFGTGKPRFTAFPINDGRFLKVELSNHNHTRQFILERDGIKFRQFYVPRMASDGSAETRYAYAAPLPRGDDLEVGSLADVGLNEAAFREMVEKDILPEKYKGLDSLLIMKNGKIVFEEHFYGENPEYLHYQASVSKTITSLLYGIALKQGVIKSVDRSVLDFFPEYGETPWGKSGERISIRDFLKMRDVVGWNEAVGYQQKDEAGNFRNDLLKAVTSGPGMYRYLFDMPILPGWQSRPFNYNTMMTNTLGLILKRASKMPLAEYSERMLFAPMNIRNAYWGAYSLVPATEAEVVPQAGSSLQLRARDMVKIGKLLMDGGRWQGRQIVPEDYIRQAATVHGINKDGYGYGYQMWLEKMSNGPQTLWTASARGHGGQFIYVIPALDAVVVTTGFNYNGRWKTPNGRDLILNRVLPLLAGSDAPFGIVKLTDADIGTAVLSAR